MDDEVALIDEDDVDEVVTEIEEEAVTHGGDYAAGMRRARLVVETTLKEKLRNSDAVVPMLDFEIEVVEE